MTTTNNTSPIGEDAANGAIGEREAFDQWFKTRGVWPRLTYLEVWQASRAALTAEKVAGQEPVTSIFDASVTLRQYKSAEPTLRECVHQYYKTHGMNEFEATNLTQEYFVALGALRAPQQPAQSAEQGERAECPQCGACGPKDEWLCPRSTNSHARCARAVSTQSSAAQPVQVERALPRVHGVSRMADNPCALLLLLMREPADDDLRAILDRLTTPPLASGSDQ